MPASSPASVNLLYNRALMRGAAFERKNFWPKLDPFWQENPLANLCPFRHFPRIISAQTFAAAPRISSGA
jgi:hypothetical protein